MRFAIVNRETGKVVNVILWEGGEFLPPRGHVVVRVDECDIDDSFDFNTNKVVRRDRTARDLHSDSVKALEAEMAIKQRELDGLKASLEIGLQDVE